MYIEVTKSIFVDYFKSVRPDNFSYEGLLALFDYLIDREGDADCGLELDVVELCSEYIEVDSTEHYDNYDDKRQAEELICKVLNNGNLIVRNW